MPDAHSASKRHSKYAKGHILHWLFSTPLRLRFLTRTLRQAFVALGQLFCERYTRLKGGLRNPQGTGLLRQSLQRKQNSDILTGARTVMCTRFFYAVFTAKFQPFLTMDLQKEKR